MELILATGNLHKGRELRDLLQRSFNFDVLTLWDFPDYVPPQLERISFADAARLKAEHAATALERLVLADESGLVVPALETNCTIGHRYCGSYDTDADNRKELLERMKETTYLKRAAYYHCSLALATPAGPVRLVTAQCEGTLLPEERGGNGFGFDPLFVKHDYDKSFAELDDATRNRISHRAKAFDRLRPALESLKQQADALHR